MYTLNINKLFPYHKNLSRILFPRWNKVHYSLEGSERLASCSTHTGCLARESPCMLSQIKESWMQFPCIQDKNAVEKLQTLKARYDGVSLRRGEDDPLFVKELSETFNLSSPNYEDIILGDTALGPNERRQQISILKDYLEEGGTQSLPVLPESDSMKRRREQLIEGERLREEGRERLREDDAERVEREQRRNEQAEKEQAAIQQEEYRNSLQDNNIASGTEDEEEFIQEREYQKSVKEEEKANGIAVMLPTNILELLSPLAVVENLSERQLEMLLAGVCRLVKPIARLRGVELKVLEKPGVNLDRMVLSHSTAHRTKLSQCSEITDNTMNNFLLATQLTPVFLTGHMDGKVMTADWSNGDYRKLQKFDFMAYSVSAPNLARPQFLGIEPLLNSTGYASALGFYNILMTWQVSHLLIAIVADTPSVNWGTWEGAVYYLASWLERQLLYIQCVHHTEELVP